MLRIERRCNGSLSVNQLMWALLKSLSGAGRAMTTGTFAGDAALAPPSRMSRMIESSGDQAGVPRLPVRLHLARDRLHGVLAHRAAKRQGECSMQPARVGTSEVARSKRPLMGRSALLFHDLICSETAGITHRQPENCGGEACLVVVISAPLG